MEAKERATCLEALAAFAWADGVVDDAERKRIQDFLVMSSDLTPPEVASLIHSVKTLSADLLVRIQQLPSGHACELLAVADAMCYGDHTPSDAEIELLKRIAVARFGEVKWPHVLGWLEHQRKADTLLDEVLLGIGDGEGNRGSC